VPVAAPPKGKAVPVVAPVPRSTMLTWVLVGVGALIVLLLAALLWTQLRKPNNAARLAERPAESQTAAPTQAPPLAAGQGQNANAATTNSTDLAQTENQKVPPATANAAAVASGQQQTANALTTDAGSMAAGEDEASWGPSQVESWAKVYAKTGSGQFTTPQLPVHRPWSIEYYSGVSPNNDLAMDEFAVFAGTGPMETPVISVSQPQYHDTQPCYKRGPTALEIVSMFNNWSIIVYQGTFKPGQG
jgi:hypothetical protein